MVDYKPGQRVRITGGSYATNLFGTFIEKCGAEGANIKVDHDWVYVRTVLLTNFCPISAMDMENFGRLATDAGYASRHNPASGNLLRSIASRTLAEGSISAGEIRRSGAWKPYSPQQYYKEKTDSVEARAAKEQNV